MQNLKPENLKFLYIPLSVLLGIAVLSIISFKLFSDRLSQQQSEINQAQGQQIVLSQKLGALEHSGNIINSVQSISFALPGENPSFIEVSQIRRYTQALGLTLSSIQIGQETTDAGGILHANVNFDVEGNPITIFSLIDKIKGAAPLTVGNNISINQKGGTTMSTFTLSVYWSPFPEKLPAITEPVSELNTSDEEILSKVANLDLPVLGSQTASPAASQTPVSNVPKTNPFGF